MDFLQDRRVLIAGGVGLALLAGVVIAFALGAGGKDPDTPPPASVGGLVVEVQQPDLKIDLTRELPCYVRGTLIGLATHQVCAERNGVSSGQLDVGIDTAGELAYGDAGALLTPLPPGAQISDPIGELTAVQPAPPQAPAQPVAACWRYADRNWVRLSEMPLQLCTQTLFDGRCVGAGEAAYGRWGDQTLRLVPGQIEQSFDNRNFRALVRQGANCSVPAF